MVFQQNLLESAYFIAKVPGVAMVRPASSVLWKAPLVTIICCVNEVISVALYNT